MRKSVRIILALALVLAGPHLCVAGAITLISSGSGVYDYGLTLNSGEIVSFVDGDTITLSGLSDVTGASVSGLFGGGTFASSFTSSSVVYTDTIPFFFGPGPTTVGGLALDSLVLTTGPVDFSIQTFNEGTLTGTTSGPVGPVPEPSSLVLFGTGLLGLLGIIRRKWSRFAEGTIRSLE